MFQYFGGAVVFISVVCHVEKKGRKSVDDEKKAWDLSLWTLFCISMLSNKSIAIYKQTLSHL